jgi:hypothetical protein
MPGQKILNYKNHGFTKIRIPNFIQRFFVSLYALITKPFAFWKVNAKKVLRTV